MLRLAITKILILLRQEGLRKTAAWFLSNLLRVQRFIVFESEIRGPLPSIQEDPDIEVRQATPENLQSVRQSHPSLPVEFYYDKVYGLRTCFLAFFQGRVAGVSWLSLPGEYNRYFDLQPGEAEGFQIYVLPEFRSYPLSRSLWRRTAYVQQQWLQAHGYRRLYARVPEANREWSRIVNRRYERIGMITHCAFYCPKFRKAGGST